MRDLWGVVVVSVALFGAPNAMGQIPAPPPRKAVQPTPPSADLFAYRLSWRWPAGHERRYRIVVRELLHASGPGGRGESGESVSTWIVTDRVVSNDDQGFTVLERSFDEVALEMRHPRIGANQPLRFESANDTAPTAAPEPLRPAAAMLGQRVRFEADNMGRVYSAEYVGDVPATLSPIDTWRQYLDAIHALVPDVDVIVGDSWNASIEATLASGPIRLDRRCKLQSVRRAGTDRVAAIAVLTEPEIPLEENPPPPTQVGIASLRSYSEHGQAQFDLIDGGLLVCKLVSVGQYDILGPDDEVSRHRLQRSIEIERLDAEPDASE